MVCDGFERSELGFDVWNSFGENGARFSLDSSRAARGSRSVRLHLDPRTTEPVGLHTGPIDSNPLPDPVWVRFYLFVPEATPHFSGAFVTFDNDNREFLSVDWDDRSLTLDGARNAPTAAGPPRGRWVCMLVKAQTAGGGELSLYIDGAPTPTLTSTLAAHPILHRLMFAISPDGTQPAPVDLFIDEVLMSRTPIGCED